MEFRLVGAGRFELPTPSPPDWCANQAALRSDRPSFCPACAWRSTRMARSGSCGREYLHELGRLCREMANGQDGGTRSGSNGAADWCRQWDIMQNEAFAFQHLGCAPAEVEVVSGGSPVRPSDTEILQKRPNAGSARLAPRFQPDPCLDRKVVFFNVAIRACRHKRTCGSQHGFSPVRWEANVPVVFDVDANVVRRDGDKPELAAMGQAE